MSQEAPVVGRSGWVAPPFYHDRSLFLRGNPHLLPHVPTLDASLTPAKSRITGKIPIRTINHEMKVAAARAIAVIVD